MISWLRILDTADTRAQLASDLPWPASPRW